MGYEISCIEAYLKPTKQPGGLQATACSPPGLFCTAYNQNVGAVIDRPYDFNGRLYAANSNLAGDRLGGGWCYPAAAGSASPYAKNPPSRMGQRILFFKIRPSPEPEFWWSGRRPRWVRSTGWHRGRQSRSPQPTGHGSRRRT